MKKTLLNWCQMRIGRHRLLWDWLFNNPEKTKGQWPEWKSNGGRLKDVIANCFLCEISERIDDDGICENSCPLFPEKPWRNKTPCLNGLFLKWHNARTNKTRKKYAAIIRDLPVNERFITLL